MLRISAAVAILLSLSACAINQNVQPVAPFSAREICLIENPAVRAGVIEAYQRTLREKGYVVKRLPPQSAVTECNVTTTYTANWQWDMAMYMSYAQIKVFRDGYQVGEASYDARGGGGNMSKFIDADKKITELVNQLYPSGSGRSLQNGS
ncbi:MAG TPA: Sbal_3080 family lipoprotein [Telluria sp.]|jgi:hypothetical protein